jgi:hypothetical protein
MLETPHVLGLRWVCDAVVLERLTKPGAVVWAGCSVVYGQVPCTR